MNPSVTTPFVYGMPDEALVAQALPRYGIPSQDFDSATQLSLEFEDAGVAAHEDRVHLPIDDSGGHSRPGILIHGFDD